MDIVIFSYSITKSIGIKSLSFTFAWYIVSALFLKFISPPLGEIMA
jgi:hypothetical protein